MQFWKDAWCREAALCTLFPSLFALAVYKEASVDDFWDSSRDPRGGGGGGGGGPLFSLECLMIGN